MTERSRRYVEIRSILVTVAVVLAVLAASYLADWPEGSRAELRRIWAEMVEATGE